MRDNPNFWYLVGVSLGDGSFGRAKYKTKSAIKYTNPYFRLNVIDKEFINKTKKSLESFSEKKARVYKIQDNRFTQNFYFALEFWDKNIVNELEGVTKSKKIFPKEIFKQSLQSKIEFITGLIDSEGRVSKNKKKLVSGRKTKRNYSLSIKMTDLFIIKGLHKLLEEINIKVNPIASEKPYKAHYKTPYLFSINIDDFVKVGCYSSIPRKNNPMQAYKSEKKMIPTPKTFSLCEMPRCNNKHLSLGLCNKHYKQYKSGKLQNIPKSVGRINHVNSNECSIKNCYDKPLAKGLCNKHYYLIRRVNAKVD